MRDSIYYIELDVHERASQVQVTMRQGDTARQVHVQLVNDGKPFVPDKGWTAVVYMAKPDGTTVFNDCDIVFPTGILTFPVTSQMTAAKGLAECHVIVRNGLGHVITSPRFTALIAESAFDGQTITSTDEFNALIKAWTGAEAALNSVGPLYSDDETVEYHEGDFVIWEYEDEGARLYRCIDDTTGGAWDADKWEPVTVAEVISESWNVNAEATAIPGGYRISITNREGQTTEFTVQTDFNPVTTINAQSTDAQIPSAKAVYSLVNNNYYTKDDTDDLLDNKADADDLSSAIESITELLNNKADADDLSDAISDINALNTDKYDKTGGKITGDVDIDNPDNDDVMSMSGNNVVERDASEGEPVTVCFGNGTDATLIKGEEIYIKNDNITSTDGLPLKDFPISYIKQTFTAGGGFSPITWHSTIWASGRVTAYGSAAVDIGAINTATGSIFKRAANISFKMPSTFADTAGDNILVYVTSALSKDIDDFEDHSIWERVRYNKSSVYVCPFSAVSIPESKQVKMYFRFYASTVSGAWEEQI